MARRLTHLRKDCWVQLGASMEPSPSHDAQRCFRFLREQIWVESAWSETWGGDGFEIMTQTHCLVHQYWPVFLKFLSEEEDEGFCSLAGGGGLSPYMRYDRSGNRGPTGGIRSSKNLVLWQYELSPKNTKENALFTLKYQCLPPTMHLTLLLSLLENLTGHTSLVTQIHIYAHKRLLPP